MGLQNFLMNRLIENSVIGKKIQSGDNVSKKGQFALDATEKNPNIEDTMAEKIANLENETKRLDNSVKKVISLPNGASTGDGQIEDAKVGIEGESYDTLGDAIREQVKTYRDVDVSNTTPTNKARVWVNTSTNDTESQDILLPQVDDANISEENTWSSKKIDSEIGWVATSVHEFGRLGQSIFSESPIEYELGGYAKEDGTKFDDTVVIRSVDLIENMSAITVDAGYKVTCNKHEKDGTYTGYDYTLHYGIVHKLDPDYKYSITVRRLDDKDMTVDEASNIHVFRAYTFTENFQLQRSRLTYMGNILYSQYPDSVDSYFYSGWHMLEMIGVVPNSRLRVSMEEQSTIRIFEYDGDRVKVNETTIDTSGNIELQRTTKYVRIDCETAYDDVSITKQINVSWFAINKEIIRKQKQVTYHEKTGHTYGIMFPVPDVHNMLDVYDDTTSVGQYNNKIGYSTGLIMLPPNYTQQGDPVNVIVFCHSSTSYFNREDMEFAEAHLQNYRYLRDEGFAIVDFWGHSSFAPVTSSTPRTYGNPDNMICYEWGIKHIMDHFNVNPHGVFVSCKSLGGEVALNLAFSSTSVPVLACGLLAPAFSPLRRSIGYTKQERLENAWAFGFEGDTDTILGDETTVVEYGTIPKEDEKYKEYIKKNAEKLIGFNPMWNGLVGVDLNTLCDWGFNLGEGDKNENNWKSIQRICKTPIKVWCAVDDTNTPYVIAKNFIKTLKNGYCNAELRSMPSNTGAHMSTDLGTTNNPSLKVSNITTACGIQYQNVPLAYVELVNYFKRFLI